MFLLCKEENETPGWTQLKLPGQAPSPRCGHTVTSGGHYVITFAFVLIPFALFFLHAAIGYCSASICMYVLILHGMYFEDNFWGCFCCYTMQSCLCSKFVGSRNYSSPSSRYFTRKHVLELLIPMFLGK